MKSKTEFSRRDFLVKSVGLMAIPIIAPMNSLASILGTKIEGEGVLVQILDKARKQNWKRLPMGEIVGLVGKELLGIPYVGKTLDLDAVNENCVVTLDGLDCVTFFESSLGIARMICLGQTGSKNLLKQVTFTRYRGGIINGYPSRLHYTADWMRDNERKGSIKLITKNLPGNTKMDKLINFMSNNPNSYAQLKQNPGLIKDVRNFEDNLNASALLYLPKHLVAAAESRLETGDIIGTTTTVEGIDCSHTGLIFVDAKGVRHFMHASLTQKKVILDVRLSDYLNSVTKHTGIMVARPIKPTR